MKIEFQGSISDSTGAIRRSGKLAGGGNIVFDVPEAFIDCLAALMPLVLLPLRVTVELADSEAIPTQSRKRSGRRLVPHNDNTDLADQPRPAAYSSETEQDVPVSNLYLEDQESRYQQDSRQNQDPHSLSNRQRSSQDCISSTEGDRSYSELSQEPDEGSEGAGAAGRSSSQMKKGCDSDAATEKNAAEVLAAWKAQREGRKPPPRPEM